MLMMMIIDEPQNLSFGPCGILCPFEEAWIELQMCSVVDFKDSGGFQGQVRVSKNQGQ